MTQTYTNQQEFGDFARIREAYRYYMLDRGFKEKLLCEYIIYQ